MKLEEMVSACMTLEIATFGKLLSPVAMTIAPQLLKAVQSKLNPNELVKALREGLVFAQAQEQEQPPGQRLFSSFLCFACTLIGLR